MKKIVLFILIIFQLLILSGCWGTRMVQGETIITGIGIDYKDNEFVVYIQALNFSNIAKQEGGITLVEAPPSLIGQASGKSIASAINKLEQKAPLPLYFGHVMNIVLSKSVIDQKLSSFNDFVSNRSLLRYNTWLFGTEEEIKEILFNESFFNLPTVYSVIGTPSLPTRKNISFHNLTYHEYISKYDQPVGSLLIPSLKINDKNFEEDVKKKIAVYNGAFAVSQKKSKGFIDLKDLSGLKWIDQVTYLLPINLTDQKVSVQVKNSSSNIKLLKGKRPEYKIKIQANALLTENEDGISQKEIIKSVNEKIKKDVLKTIKKGDELKVDLLNISEKPYRFSKKWDVKTINDINAKSIKEIDVNVNILQRVNFKR